ncbi:MAG: hypothetical protein J4215_01490 [Candidatus Diapherotrites archaeon]|uniref:Uncharacterized protein n=1 Tax=Candidatus Iainarchaeum sp. TaxID=3101447 RepID=A0A8T4L1M5_9ARCH|nr:hypothetical protein [Candidatus Diapherotrites archaeon]
MTSDNNIIDIIRKMIKSGYTQEQIEQNLSELGVTAEKAQRLIMISQSDVQDAIQTEINQIVHDQMEKERQRLLVELKEEISRQETEAENRLEQKMRQEQAEYAKNQETKMANDEIQLSQGVNKALEISQLAREKAILQEQRINAIQAQGPRYSDVPREHHRGTRVLQILFFLAGVGVAAFTLYYIFANQDATFTGDNVYIVVGMAIFAVVIMYLSTLA